jgi:hypothetical protein
LTAAAAAGLAGGFEKYTVTALAVRNRDSESISSEKMRIEWSSAPTLIRP